MSGATGKDVYTIVAQTDLAGITGVRLEALPDAALPAGGPGRAQNGNFVLNELRLSVAPKSDASKSDASKSQAVSLRNGLATFHQEMFPAANAVDGNEGTGWAVSPRFNEAHTATFETATEAGGAGGSALTFQMSQQFPDGMHLLGRFRLSVTTSKRPFEKGQLPAEVAAALAVAADKRSPQQAAALSNHFRSLDTRWQELNTSVARSAEQLKNRRLLGVQDLAWALINNPAFLFNR